MNHGGLLKAQQAKSYTLYPEFSVSATDKVSISAWKLRTLKHEKLQELYKALSSGKELTRVKKFFVSLPTEAAHAHETHCGSKGKICSTNASPAHSKGNGNGSNGNNRTNRSEKSSQTLCHFTAL